MILPRKEFYSFVGLKSNSNLTQYINRGKVVMNDEGLIDTENEINKDWIKARAAKGLTTDAAAAVVGFKVEKEPDVDSVSKGVELSDKSKEKIEKSTVSRHKLELSKLKAEVEKKKVDIELAREKLSTLKAENVPISLVTDIISKLSTSLINNYKTFSEQQVSEICHKFKIKDKDKVKIISKSLSGLNKIHRKAVNDAKNEFKANIGDYKIKGALSDEKK